MGTHVWTDIMELMQSLRKEFKPVAALTRQVSQDAVEQRQVIDPRGKEKQTFSRKTVVQSQEGSKATVNSRTTDMMKPVVNSRTGMKPVGNSSNGTQHASVLGSSGRVRLIMLYYIIIWHKLSLCSIYI